MGSPSLLFQRSQRLSQHAGEPSCCFGAGLTPEGDAIPAMSDPSCGTEEAPFQAVMVFSDPVDWYRDLQLITDVVMSGQNLQSQCLYSAHDMIESGLCVCVHWHAGSAQS